VREALAAAESAFLVGRRTAYERAGYLYDAYRLMLERADGLSRLGDDPVEDPPRCRRRSPCPARTGARTRSSR
jgi:hypothetical protein